MLSCSVLSCPVLSHSVLHKQVTAVLLKVWTVPDTMLPDASAVNVASVTGVSTITDHSKEF